MDNHFKYISNMCEKCSMENTYEEVPESEYNINDYGYIIDDELESANHHSFCGIGKSLCSIIDSHIEDEEIKKTLMKKIYEEFYKII